MGNEVAAPLSKVVVGGEQQDLCRTVVTVIPQGADPKQTSLMRQMADELREGLGRRAVKIGGLFGRRL